MIYDQSFVDITTKKVYTLCAQSVAFCQHVKARIASQRFGLKLNDSKTSIWTSVNWFHVRDIN